MFDNTDNQLPLLRQGESANPITCQELKISVLEYDPQNDILSWMQDDLNISKKFFPHLLDDFKTSDKLSDFSDNGSKLCWFEDDNNEEQWMIVNKNIRMQNDSTSNHILTLVFIPVDDSLFEDKSFKKIFNVKQKNQLLRILTKREIQILKGICQGETVNDTASNLFLSHHTVISHRKNIGKKLKTSKSTRLAAIGSAMGVLN